jgi:hypothetical protein
VAVSRQRPVRLESLLFPSCSVLFQRVAPALSRYPPEVMVWVFLSSRLRAWLLLAVALPLVRAVLRRASASAAQRDPGSRAARGLRSLESNLGRLDRRQRRRGR